MSVNSLNAVIFGHEDAAFHVASLEVVDPSTITTAYGALPGGFAEVGWLSPDGSAITPEDSVTDHTGHQGGGTVVQSMESSKTSVNVPLLETRWDTFQRIWSARDSVLSSETVGGESVPVNSFTLPRRRQIEHLVGVYDDWNTAGGGGKIRIVFPLLSLGAREAMALSNNAITGHSMSLQLLEDARVLTSLPGMVEVSGPQVASVLPDEASVGDLVTISGVGLAGATAVEFGAVNAPSFTVVSDSKIVVTVPAGTAGSAPVKVTTPAGSTTVPYTRG